MKMTNTYFVGIDGGGTSCRARLSDSTGRILGEAKAGSANVFQDSHKAWQSVQQAVELAFQQAKLPISCYENTIVVAGLAGAEVTPCANEFKSLATGFSHIELLTDAQIACLGAHGGEDGAVFIIGTGSIGISLHKDQWKRVGGWGFPLDDIGSGAWLGQQAIRVALRTLDGILPPNLLSEKIWEAFPNGSSEIIAWSQTASSGNYGQFSPTVLQAFASEDIQAKQIVAEQIKQLTIQIEALVQPDDPICLMGGLSEWVAGQLPEKLKKQLTEPKSDALSGALSLAHRRIS